MTAFRSIKMKLMLYWGVKMGHVDMEKLKKVELEILLEFDRICKMNDIKYQLFAGTLLGAVRHKGFIPWDDDIDVCMLRKDYNRFIEVCKRDLGIEYFLQHYNIDQYSIYNFIRLRKNKTMAFQESWTDLDMHKGIFIDVFPMDNIFPDKLIGKIQRDLLFIIKKIKPIKVKKVAYSSRYLILKYIKILIHYFLRPFSIQTINRIENKLVCLFQNKETIYSTILTDSKIKDVYYKFMIKNDEFYDTIEMEFEGHLFPVPTNYDEILTKNYGDYMTPPPPEQQKPHHKIINVCFDTKSET